MTKRKAVWFAFSGIVFFLAIGIILGIVLQPMPKELIWTIVVILAIPWFLYSRAFGAWAILAGLAVILAMWAGVIDMIIVAVAWGVLAALTAAKTINRHYAA